MRRNLAIVGMSLAVLVAAAGCNRGSTASSSEGSAPPSNANAAAPAQNQNLAGNYTISSSSNPGGGPGYKGSVSITPSGSSYQLAWTIANSPSYRGVAIPVGDTLAVGWGMGSTSYGVAVYNVSGGSLKGQWATSASPAVGTEDLEGPAGLRGTYRIASAKGPDGSTYSGSVVISPNGQTFNVKWMLANGQSYSGVGIQEGNLLVVGWGIGGQGAGVVSYKIGGGGLNGRWASPGGTQLGSELLTKS